jgi:GMP synthase-like glutamine amidotransferase
MLETRNVHVTAYDFFNPNHYKMLENDDSEYDALVLGSQGGGASKDGYSRKGLWGHQYINLHNSKGLDEIERKLFRVIQKYRSKPIIGICYGAQALNWFYGGETSAVRENKKTGYKSVELDTTDPLFMGLPPDIIAEFNTWHPGVPSTLSNTIAVTKEDNSVAALSFPNNHYALYFHIVHGDTVLQKIIDNFISITEKEKKYRTIMKVSTLGLLLGLYVMFM